MLVSCMIMIMYHSIMIHSLWLYVRRLLTLDTDSVRVCDWHWLSNPITRSLTSSVVIHWILVFHFQWKFLVTPSLTERVNQFTVQWLSYWVWVSLSDSKFHSHHCQNQLTTGVWRTGRLSQWVIGSQVMVSHSLHWVHSFAISCH